MNDSTALQEQARGVFDLLRRCNKEKPKKEDLAALRALLAKAPGLWRMGIDLCKQMYLQAVAQVTATPVIKESLEAGWWEMRRELGYDGATETERLLIEHVVLCWLRMQLCEHRYQENIAAGTRTLAQADYDERRMNATQLRYLRALETLARVRRLLRVPAAVQVNIGEKQVNLAGG